MSTPVQRDRVRDALVAQPRTGAGTEARVARAQTQLDQLQGEILLRSHELNAAKTDFVGRVSHELRSPLTSLLGYLEVLQEATVGPLNGEQRRMLEIMDRNTHRLLSLVTDLLTAEHAELGAFPVHPVRVQLSGIVGHLMELLDRDIQKKGLRCTVTVEPSIELDADPAELERMLAHLVANSIKFTPAGGHIELEASTEADQVVITIRDTGIGIPIDEQSNLFASFFRSTSSDVREIQGAGLGLFIVKQIALAHGGAVTVASIPDAGTAVTVQLPLGCG